MPRTVTSRLSVLAMLILAALCFTGCSKSGPSGSYEAKEPGGEGTLTLDFEKDSKVKVTLAAPMGKYEFTCDYKMDGDKVILSPPAGSPMGDVLTLVPKGSGYEAKEAGETITFVKK